MSERDPLELQREKIAAEQQRLANGDKGKLPANAKRLTDVIEARKRKMTASLERRRETARQKRVVLPKHLVVIVEPLADPPPRPQPKEPEPVVEDEEDYITRRLREARERLKGL